MTQQGYIRPLTVKRLTVYPLSLRMKRKVSHAASERVVAQPIVVAVELGNGMVGYGEALPRDYVTGENQRKRSRTARSRRRICKAVAGYSPGLFRPGSGDDRLFAHADRGREYHVLPLGERWSWLFSTHTSAAVIEVSRILSDGWGYPVSAIREVLRKSNTAWCWPLNQSPL